MLDVENCALVIIDIQEKLVNATTKQGENAAKNAYKVSKAAHILSIPTIITEQYPKGLGETIPAIKEIIADDTPIIEKSSFSALCENNFQNNFNKLAKKQIIICGIETHICVFQTAMDLISQGYEIFIINNACASRNIEEHNTAITLLRQHGAKILTTEIILFEWLKTSKHPHFKEIQNLIK